MWLLFLAGAGCAVLGAMSIGIGLIALSVLLKVLLVFLKDGPVSAMLSVFDFSGFIGDMFSYARLMAMAVGTAGVALAINFIGLLVADLIPTVGVVLAGILLFVGHLFNMAMNGLGAFVHTVRLHFLEFFTKFYYGGGKGYKPFHATKLR